MPRAREFDADQALDLATELFWSKGYERTSIADLEEHLGLGRQSIYSAFGDKQQLYAAVLARYASRQPAARVPLFRPDAGLLELKAFFENLIRLLTGEPRRSCLLINSALEMREPNPELGRAAHENEKHLVRGLKHTLAGAVKRRELKSVGDVDAAALFLVSQVYGLNVMSRQGSSAATLRRVAERALGALK